MRAEKINVDVCLGVGGVRWDLSGCCGTTTAFGAAAGLSIALRPSQGVRAQGFGLSALGQKQIPSSDAAKQNCCSEPGKGCLGFLVFAALCCLLYGGLRIGSNHVQSI